MKRYGITAVAFVVLTLLMASSASAITLKFTGKSYANTIGGPNVGPYSFELDGKAVAGICNDYAGSITSGQSWVVNQYSLDDASLNGPPPAKYQGTDVGGNIIDQTDFRAAAYLANQMLALHTNWTSSANNPQLTHLQYAIWTIFNAGTPPGGVGSPADQTAIAGLRSQAYAANYSGGGWALFTPANSGDAARQSVLIRVPEASVLGLLGLNFGALFMLGYAFRRRIK